MYSFRTELEQVHHGTKGLVEKDILELDQKIREFKEGKLPDQKFRSLRLARGVYGQRQQGVQMIRIKLPYGKISTAQLRKIAAVSDQYSNGNLHLTTRQDIQIHYVSLDKTPELWAKLEQDEITLREACGNTIRNITASVEAGVDPSEPFDITPYADAVFRYFLRKPFGQDLGRKVKIAFSNNENDTALTFIHDIGFIAKLNEKNERGFKVLLGGGLGAQPFLAKTAYNFLPKNKLIPFIEAAIRVFDRYGERVSRHKARLKYLIAKIGLDEFLKLLEQEERALLHTHFEIQDNTDINTNNLKYSSKDENILFHTQQFKEWFLTNTFKQKQTGYYGVYIKVQLGNISSHKARELADIIDKYADPKDSRITINQGFFLRYIKEEELFSLFKELKKANLADIGFNSVADITACPGTDTCNLAISNSTLLSVELEKVINQEFPDLVYNKDIKIKISGCMNSCGQHGIAQIGFHGSSFKIGSNVVPAVQVLLGGGSFGDGKFAIAEKVIKVATKRAPEVLRKLLNDFRNNALENEKFNVYVERKGKEYFYQLLKPVSDNASLLKEEYYDWGSEEKFKTEIGIGECAGVIIDLVQTLFYEAQEKLELSAEAFANNFFGDSIYHSYASFIHTAKAILLNEGYSVNTHYALINDFQKHFVETGKISIKPSFKELVMQINKNKPSKAFAEKYFKEASVFLENAKAYRMIANSELHYV